MAMRKKRHQSWKTERPAANSTRKLTANKSKQRAFEQKAAKETQRDWAFWIQGDKFPGARLTPGLKSVPNLCYLCFLLFKLSLFASSG
jgi:hypothetical protein